MMPAMLMITIEVMLFSSEPIVLDRCTRRLASVLALSRDSLAPLCRLCRIIVGIPMAARSATRSMSRCRTQRTTTATMIRPMMASGFAINQFEAWASDSLPVQVFTR